MYDCEKKAAKDFIKEIMEKWAAQGSRQEKLYQLEEKIIILQSLIARITADKCQEADKNVYRITNYSRKGRRELLLDVNELMSYLEEGHTLSGYLFSLKKIFVQKQLRKRLYMIDEIFVDGKPCNRFDRLALLQNVLKVDLTLNDLTHIWGTQNQEFASYTQHYHFFLYLLVEAIDYVQNYNLASLALENLKWSLERNSQ